MAGLLLEILVADDRRDAALDPSELAAVRGAIDDALVASDLGEVTGTTHRDMVTSIDVELDDEQFMGDAVVLLRRVLQDLGRPPLTPILRCNDDFAEAGARSRSASAVLFDPSWSRRRPEPAISYGRAAS